MFHLNRCFGFEIATNDGLGTACSEGDPFVVREEELVAVGRDKLFNFAAPDFV